FLKVERDAPALVVLGSSFHQRGTTNENSLDCRACTDGSAKRRSLEKRSILGVTFALTRVLLMSHLSLFHTGVCHMPNTASKSCLFMFLSCVTRAMGMSVAPVRRVPARLDRLLRLLPRVLLPRPREGAPGALR